VTALNEYFAAIANAPDGISSNLKIQWVVKPAFKEDEEIDDKAATTAAKAILKLPGDAGRGEALFARTCQYCHGIKEKKVGPSLEKASEGGMDFVAKTLRVGSGAMPFYAKDVLTDAQLSDVLAYVQQQLGK